MSYYGQQQPPVGVPPPQGYPAKDQYPPPGYPPPEYAPAPPPPVYVAPQYAPQHPQPPPEKESTSTGCLEGCFAVLCCCCLLDACY